MLCMAMLPHYFRPQYKQTIRFILRLSFIHDKHQNSCDFLRITTVGLWRSF